MFPSSYFNPQYFNPQYFIGQSSTGSIIPPGPGAYTMHTKIQLGPYISAMSQTFNTVAVSGITVDVFPGGVLPSVGGGTYSVITNTSGLVSFEFNQTVDSNGWYIRSHYPAGYWDSNQPSFVLETIFKLF